MSGRPDEVIGRDRELAELSARLAPLADRRSVVVGVSGEAGIGKTTLLQQAVSQLGIASVWVAGQEHDVTSPTRAVADMAQGLSAETWASLAPPEREVLEALLGIGAVPGGPRIIAALVAAAEAAAAVEPILFVIDDLQWIDPLSLELLAAVVPRVAGDAIGLLYAGRTVPASFARFNAPLELSGLAFEATEELARRHGVVPAVAVPLARRTGGNPLATITVARALSDSQRRGVSQLPRVLGFGRRLVDAYIPALRRLPPECRIAVTVLAAAEGLPGDTIGRALAAASLDAASLAPAEAAGLVDDHRLVHPVARSAALSSATLEHRQIAHRALASLVDPNADPERYAWHLGESGEGDAAAVAEALHAAAMSAYTRGAMADAARYDERSATMTTDAFARFDRSFFAAMLLACYGEAAAARAPLEFAIGAAPSTAQRLLAETMRPIVSGRPAAGAIDDLRSSAMAHAEESPEGALLQLICAMQLCAMHGDLRRGTAIAAEIRAVYEHVTGLPSEVPSLAAEIAESLGASMSDLRTAPLMARMAASFESHAVRPESVRYTGDTTSGFSYAAALLLANERWDDAVATLERVVEHNRDTGWYGAFAESVVWLVEAYWRSGRWSEAFQIGMTGLDSLTGGRPNRGRAALLYSELAKVQACLGRTAECEEFAVAAIGDRVGLQLGLPIVTVAHARALIALGAGDAERAAGHLADIEEWAEAGGLEHPGWVWWRADQIEALTRAGRMREARVALQVFERHAERAHLEVVTAQVLRCRAHLAADRSEARAWLLRAVEQLGRTPATFELARTRLALATTEAALGDRTASAASARAALTTFDQLGARPWSAQAAELLDGERTESPTGVLTDRELRVALLVLDGLANKKIAAELGVSPKTVEFHLGNIYRKLHVASRTELVRRLMPPRS